MYSTSTGVGTGAVTTVAGIAVLPNTGGNEALLTASLVTVILGSAVLITTVARMVAKRAYKQ